MATALYKPGQAEKRLDALYSKREDALQAWDATAYNRYDRAINAVLAAMRAEVRLGLRVDPMLAITLEAA